jgi:hypothetical protein
LAGALYKSGQWVIDQKRLLTHGAEIAKEAIRGPHFLVHPEGNETCGKWLYFDSDLSYETQDVAVVDAADPPFLWSVPPRRPTSCLIGATGAGASVKLILWKGSILV